MSADDIRAAVALAVEQAMKLVVPSDAPKPKVKPAAGDDLKAKRLAGLEKAREAKKAKAKAAPAAAPVKVAKQAAKPAAESKKRGPTSWTVKPYTTKRTKKAGKIVQVGGWSCFIEDGQEEDAITSINEVFRKGVCNEVVNAIRS